MDKNMNSLLKWGIEHSTPSTTAVTSAPTDAETDAPSTAPSDDTAAAAAPRSDLTPDVLAALFGGPSEADLMKAAIEVITDTDPENTLENRLIAFDNFEQLIESLDNANNLENLSLWTPLLSLLEHEEREFRRMAAWCVGTAVQNNARTQERLFAMGGIPKLVTLATREDETEGVRRKAVYALSSAVRNYQPAMDVAADELGLAGEGKKVDATDMDAVDEIMNRLKEQAKGGTKA